MKKVDRLAAIAVKNSLLSEIKALQTEFSLRLEIKSSAQLTMLKTKYWDWYPYHCKQSPDAELGDLFLGRDDYCSSNAKEIVAAFKLLEKIVFFVREYKPDLKELLV